MVPCHLLKSGEGTASMKDLKSHSFPIWSHLVPSGPIHSAAVSEADRRFVERTPFPGPVLLVAVWRKLSSHAMLQPLRQQVRYRFVWKWLERVQERFLFDVC